MPEALPTAWETRAATRTACAAPRANWCPGSETPPFVFDAGALAAPGSHTVDWTIKRIDDGGGEWETSVTYFAIGE